MARAIERKKLAGGDRAEGRRLMGAEESGGKAIGRAKMGGRSSERKNTKNITKQEGETNGENRNGREREREREIREKPAIYLKEEREKTNRGNTSMMSIMTAGGT